MPCSQMIMRHSSRGILLLFAMWLFAPCVAAQSADQEERARRRLTHAFYIENDDLLTDRGSDRNYTNGFRYTRDYNYDIWRIQRLGRLFAWVPSHYNCARFVPTDPPHEKCVSTSFHFGQQFYTPDKIDQLELIPDDRPYAGWLYVGGAWAASTASGLVRTDVYLGVTGEWSFAEEFQTAWHRIVDATAPLGWENQIGKRVGLIVGHSRHWAWDPHSDGKRWLEVVPYVGANGGNILVDGYGGARIKAGYNIARDWLQTGIAPRVGGRGTDAGWFEAYGVADVQARGVLYNAFLDAADLHVLEREGFVGEGGVGFGVRLGRFSFSFRKAWVSREYEQALRRHAYKALRITYTTCVC